MCICKCYKNTFAGPFQMVSHAYPTKSSAVKSFLKNLAKMNLNKVHNFVLTRVMLDRWSQNFYFGPLYVVFIFI